MAATAGRQQSHHTFHMDSLKNLYLSHFGQECESATPIVGSASDRRYMRLSGPAGPAIGVLGTDRQENATFIYIDESMRANGINAPEIYGVSEDGMAYLQQDLGDVSLLTLLHTPEGDAHVREVMRKLPDIQFGLGVDERRLYPVRDMNESVAMWDLHYFKYCFLKATGIEFDESALERDFATLIGSIWHGSPVSMIYRDCQSRNIMVHDDRVWWIDFQSMRKGPVLYDVASFLWQARAGFDDDERAEFSAVYHDSLNRYVPGFSRSDFDIMTRRMALMRTLQVLGAYGLRGLTERKAKFVQSIPAALANAVSLTESEAGKSCPELARVIRRTAGMERFSPTRQDGRLQVKVFSFSYKKGYPEDLSGNGGGFMFDCRAMHNPGRYEEYKALTGRDKPVISFLEKQGEVQPFLDAAMELADPAVDRYIRRGFTSLQIGFGCTGGRHRSVYCAEKMARHLADRFGDLADITLIHREQDIKEKL